MSSARNLLTRVARAHQWLSRECACLPVRLAAFALLTLVLTWPLLRTASEFNTFRDAQVLVPYEQHAVWSVVRHHQFPLWDPYYCGGLYALGTPQGRFVSPTFLLSILWGANRADAIIAMLMMIVGLEGMYRYARSRGAPGFGAVLAAPVFAVSGNFATASFFGWANFFGYALLPWAAFGVRHALRDPPRGMLTVAFALAWMVGFGGTYAAPMTALVCVYETVEALARRARRPTRMARVLVVAFCCAVLAVGIAGVRLWPVFETLVTAPRVIGGEPSVAWKEIGTALFDRVDFRFGAWHGSDGAYLIGLLVIPAAVAGFLRLRSLPVILLGALALWAATGHAFGWSPFVGLKALPIYSVLRVPERYLVLLGFAVATLAATGIRVLEARARKRVLWAIPLAVVSLSLAANLFFHVQNHHASAGYRKLTPSPPELQREFHQARGNRWANIHYGPMSRGSLSCWDAYPVPQSPLLRGDLLREAHLTDVTAGTVTQRAWSPNRIDFDIALERPAHLRINQNWHPGWRSTIGGVVRDDGLLTVDLPAGTYPLAVRFLPRSAIGGALVTLLALASAIWIAVRARQGMRLEARRDWAWLMAVAIGPLVAVPISWHAIREPAAPPSVMRAPTGEPIVADSPPHDAAPIGAVFDVGAILEAVRIEPEHYHAGDVAILELDWRLTREVPKETGVFVHVEAPRGNLILADHKLISAFLDLRYAPVGKTLRDRVPVVLPDQARIGQWTVWVGLWDTGPRMARHIVTDPGHAAEVVQNRVQAGTFQVLPKEE